MPKTLKRNIKHFKCGTENIVTLCVQATYQVQWIYNAHENNKASASCFALYNTKIKKNQLCKQIKLNMTVKKECYSLCEPKLDAKEAYVRKMKKQIALNSALGDELICAFRSTCKRLAEKI